MARSTRLSRWLTARSTELSRWLMARSTQLSHWLMARSTRLSRWLTARSTELSRWLTARSTQLSHWLMARSTHCWLFWRRLVNGQVNSAEPLPELVKNTHHSVCALSLSLKDCLPLISFLVFYGLVHQMQFWVIINYGTSSKSVFLGLPRGQTRHNQSILHRLHST